MGKRAEKLRKCGWFLVLSLATCLVLSAPTPAMTSSVLLKDEASGDAALALRAAAKNLEDAKTVSAVQDWSLLCKELCGAGLGVVSTPEEAKDTILRPESKVAKCRQFCGLSKDNWGDRVCSTFCRQQNRALSGCSPCQQAVPGVEKDEEEMKMASEIQDDASHGSGSVTSPKPVAVVAIAATDTDTTTASPDWNELCKALCKTGDGGSLCNCDLSPFFS
ncbi:uncharacterized protein [Drosophila bipectinata]|uniref:uncharacterized protein n=1 Tax=Drosophila bipectinata TaxID=42026 RepID=UPI001C8A1949|nr:uncharacterized protein LOC108122332 [Drosophila bipectinata]